MKYLDETGLKTLWGNIKTYVASQSGGSSSFATAAITTPADGACGTNAEGYTTLMNAYTNKQPVALKTDSGLCYTATYLYTTGGTGNITVEFFVNESYNSTHPVPGPTLYRIVWQSTGDYTMSCQICLTYSYLFAGRLAVDITKASQSIYPIPSRATWVYNVVSTSASGAIIDFSRACSYSIPFELTVFVKNRTSSVVNIGSQFASVDNKYTWSIPANGVLEMNARFVNTSSSSVSGSYELFLRVL